MASRAGKRIQSRPAEAPAIPSVWRISYHLPGAVDVTRLPERYGLMEAWRICAGLNEEYPGVPHWLTLADKEQP